MPRLSLALPEGGGLDPRSLFGDLGVTDVGLEVGFGGGEHLAAQAATNPRRGFIGCEPFLNGVVNLVDVIEREHLSNVRLFMGDARRVLAALVPDSLACVWVLFPDPWPKLRHAKRRFIEPATLDLLARVLKSGATLRCATDVPDLAVWMRDHLNAHPRFVREYDAPSPPPDHVPTRYERKALLAGRVPTYLEYRRP